VPTARANGIQFSYLEAGSGPLVLLLHGFPDTAHTWDRTMAELASAGFHAVAPFLRGYHPTELAGPYDSDTLGNDALGLIEALGGERAFVVGHDWGASAGYSAAALGPERIRLLVTLAVPHPRSIRTTPRTLWGFRHFLRLRRPGAAAWVRAGGMAYIDELWRRWSPAWKDLPASETAQVKAAFAEPGCLEAACAYYATAAASIPPKLPPSHRKDIAVPTVAFAGEDDSIITTRTYEKARHCFTGSYEVVAVPGGHFMHREHPEVFVPELRRVLEEAKVRP